MDKLVEQLLNYLTDFKAKNISLFDVRENGCEEDFVILSNFANTLENKDFADNIVKKFGLADFPEGYHKGEWIVFMLEKVALHTFIPSKREKYNLDKLYQSNKVSLPKSKAKK